MPSKSEGKHLLWRIAATTSHFWNSKTSDPAHHIIDRSSFVDSGQETSQVSYHWCKIWRADEIMTNSKHIQTKSALRRSKVSAPQWLVVVCCAGCVLQSSVLIPLGLSHRVTLAIGLHWIQGPLKHEWWNRTWIAEQQNSETRTTHCFWRAIFTRTSCFQLHSCTVAQQSHPSPDTGARHGQCGTWSQSGWSQTLLHHLHHWGNSHRVSGSTHKGFQGYGVIVWGYH